VLFRKARDVQFQIITEALAGKKGYVDSAVCVSSHAAIAVKTGRRAWDGHFSRPGPENTD
jgi:hypothetical protein